MLDTKQKKFLGNLGEELCCDYLARKGYQVLARNYRKWGGEIDIIARDREQQEIVFIEVKTRRDTHWFDLDQTVGGEQVYHIKKIAKRFLFEKSLEDENWRVDHVAILLGDENEILRLEHFEAI
ncbi:YraN family protein [Candidatus Dojkabacteria bacterium]|nr:YraN family protein [Candidatus Dojkabacteria bacterium]